MLLGVAQLAFPRLEYDDLRHLLDRLFPPPGNRGRARPDEILYGADETPPVRITCVMGAQHAFLALIFTVYSAIAARSIGLDAVASTAFVSSSIFLLGAGTVLQSLRSRFGAGMILVCIPAAGRLPIFIAVTAHYGLGATMGATVINGLLAIFLARFLPKLRPVFPPEVVGVVVLMVGMTLITAGVTRGVGLNPGGIVSGAAFATALASIASIVAVSLWAPPTLRRLSIVAGVAAGTLVALLTAVPLGGGRGLAHVALIAVPVMGLPLPMPEFGIEPIALFFVLQILGTMDQFGSALAMDKMDDARWRRADMKLAARAVTANGIAQIFHGFFGLLPNTTSSANIGLAHATGVTSRHVGTAAGLLMMAAAFLPVLARAISTIPEPVIGGILIYTASYMIVAGMGLVMSRLMNNQRSFTVGLALVCGVSVMLLPELGRSAPEWSRLIVNSGLTVGSIVAIGLNALLRIGVKRHDMVLLNPTGEGREAGEFLERSAKAWGATKDVAVRADFAINEALGVLRQSGVAGSVTLSASFDEFYLRCVLIYRGKALALQAGARLDHATFLEGDDDALDAAMWQVSSLLIRRLADDVGAVQRQEDAELMLTFDV